MKWLFVPLFFLLPMFLTAREAKPTFHALIVCDMDSKDIQRGSRADMVRMKKSLLAISHQLEISPKVAILQGKQFTTKNVTQWLRSLPSHSNDIVFFYYSGHGGRVASRHDSWPFMIFPTKNDPKHADALMGKEVYRYLQQKHPRLSVIMFDSCNNSVQTKNAASLSQAMVPVLSKKTYLPGLATLFLKTRGIITSCAASPGETAATTVQGNVTGGVFTTGFLYSLMYYATNSSVSWKDIFSGTSSYCYNHNHGRQHPVYSIEIAQ